MIEILPKVIPTYFIPQVIIGCCDNPNIYFLRFIFSHPGNSPLLQHHAVNELEYRRLSCQFHPRTGFHH